MGENGRRVLVGIDFIGDNFPSALYSLQRWAAYLVPSDQFESVIGVSTSCGKRDPLPGFSSLTAAEALHVVKNSCSRLDVFHWDTGVGNLAATELSSKGITSYPFWPEFSYGGVINRLLLLATVAGCDFVVRVDPGTLPPAEKSFDEIMSDHLSSMSTTGSVVSRGYEGRLALRDTFVVDGKADEHCDLVRDMTGVNPRAQVTGGAMFTSRVPGTPAPPFRAYELETGRTAPTLVWASDDGIYQTLPSTRSSKKIEAIGIARFDAVGKHKPPEEYYRGVAGAVFLAAIRQSHQDPTERVRVFLEQLTELLDDGKCLRIDGNPKWKSEFTRENVAPDRFLARIKEGWNNYQQLCKDWPAIAGALKTGIGVDNIAG